MFKFFWGITFILVFLSGVSAEESNVEPQQQIVDFSLSGVGEKGKKNWDLTGKSADIVDEAIKLNEVVSNFYGAGDNMQVTADKGNYSRKDGKLQLEDNVVVTISPSEKKAGNKIIITCDGPVEMDYQKKVTVFKNNVKVDTADTLIYSDIMDVYFSSDAKAQPSFGRAQIDKIKAYGNVKVVRGENISYSDEALYNISDNKIILLGRPKLVISSTEELGAGLKPEEASSSAPAGN